MVNAHPRRLCLKPPKNIGCLQGLPDGTCGKCAGGFTKHLPPASQGEIVLDLQHRQELQRLHVRILPHLQRMQAQLPYRVQGGAVPPHLLRMPQAGTVGDLPT
jgi:hypothetical protein